MSICGWIILGGLAGWIASLITGRNDQMGCLTNIIVGVIGAALGGWAAALIIGTDFVAGFNIISLVVAVAGAVVLLVIIGFIRRPKK